MKWFHAWLLLLAFCVPTASAEPLSAAENRAVIIASQRYPDLQRADSPHYKAWYADYPRSLLDFGGMSQRALLKLLKLPDSAALVKLFRKIPPESVDHRLWQAAQSAASCRVR